jgi:hypothetical protein
MSVVAVQAVAEERVKGIREGDVTVTISLYII